MHNPEEMKQSLLPGDGCEYCGNKPALATQLGVVCQACFTKRNGIVQSSALVPT